jgi:O-antigen/teichoic acid export membrane protein
MVSGFVYKPMLPVYSDYIGDKDYKRLLRSIIKQCLSFLFLTVLCILVVYSFGMNVLGTIFEKNLTPFKFEMSLILVSGFVFSITQFFYYIILILRRQKVIFWTSVISLIVSFLAGLILVNTHGIAGAVLSFAAGQLCMLILFIGFLVIKYGMITGSYMKKREVHIKDAGDSGQ